MDTLASMRKCKHPKGLEFCALISGGVEYLELLKA
jgi:hypothetical protein